MKWHLNGGIDYIRLQKQLFDDQWNLSWSKANWPINQSTRWGHTWLLTEGIVICIMLNTLCSIITFAHGNHTQGNPIAMVLTVHHNRLFQTLQNKRRRLKWDFCRQTMWNILIQHLAIYGRNVSKMLVLYGRVELWLTCWALSKSRDDEFWSSSAGQGRLACR